MKVNYPMISKFVKASVARWVAAAIAVSASASGMASDAGAVTVLENPTALKGAVKVAKETGHLRLFVREGSLLTLPKPAAKVFVATPGIASYQMPSPDKVFFFGQSVGTTTFYALDDAGAVIAAVKLVVEHDLTKLKRDIASAVPNAKVELEPALNGRMIVRGTVKTAADARHVVQLVETYLAASNASAGAGAQGTGGHISPTLSSV